MEFKGSGESAKISGWANGDSGLHVRGVIDQNFNNLNNCISKLSHVCIALFTKSDWNSAGIIHIDYKQYNKPNPCVDLYIKNGNSYSLVCGGYEVNDYGIRLLSDMPYEGKVVIR